jgi:hypothetical protein
MLAPPHPRLSHPSQHVHELLHLETRVEARGGFVQDDDAWLGDHLDAALSPLLLPATQPARHEDPATDVGVGAAGEAQRRQDLINDGLDRLHPRGSVQQSQSGLMASPNCFQHSNPGRGINAFFWRQQAQNDLIPFKNHHWQWFWCYFWYIITMSLADSYHHTRCILQCDGCLLWAELIVVFKHKKTTRQHRHAQRWIRSICKFWRNF